MRYDETQYLRWTAAEKLDSKARRYSECRGLPVRALTSTPSSSGARQEAEVRNDD